MNLIHAIMILKRDPDYLKCKQIIKESKQKIEEKKNNLLMLRRNYEQNKEKINKIASEINDIKELINNYQVIVINQDMYIRTIMRTKRNPKREIVFYGKAFVEYCEKTNNFTKRIGLKLFRRPYQTRIYARDY